MSFPSVSVNIPRQCKSVRQGSQLGCHHVIPSVCLPSTVCQNTAMVWTSRVAAALLQGKARFRMLNGGFVLLRDVELCLLKTTGTLLLAVRKLLNTLGCHCVVMQWFFFFYFFFY